MHGSRSISTFMGKSRMLAALAAAVLLAASPGTAAAQSTTGITITGPADGTVNEGGTATYTVTVEGFIPANTASSNTVTVSLTTPLSPDNSDAATAGEASDVSTNEGTSVSFEVPANTSPTNVVRFAPAAQQIRVKTHHDEDAEDETFTLAFSLSSAGGVNTTAAGGTAIGLATAGGLYRPNSLTIKDDETQTYVFYPIERPEGINTFREGQAALAIVIAEPWQEDGSEEITLNYSKDGTEGWLNLIRTCSNPGGNTQCGDFVPDGHVTTVGTYYQQGNPVGHSWGHFMVLSPASDGNRVDDTFTVTAHSGVAGAAKLEDTVEITLLDAHALPEVAAKVVDENGKVLEEQPTSVEEGETIRIAVMPLDEDGKQTTAGEKLAIMLAPSGDADARDYRPLGAIEIAQGQNLSNVVELVVEEDGDVGMETLMLDATVSGEAVNGTETSTSAGVLSIGIEDATAKKITHKPNADTTAAVEAAMAEALGDGEGLNPGESFTVMMTDLFDPPMDGYAASYGASVSAGGVVSYSVSGDAVTVTAEKAGDATVTVTATAREATSSATGSQSVSNVAEVEIPVTVADKVLTLTLDAPGAMDGNVVEGMDYDITVTANRAVLEDTAVTFMRGEMSEADVRDYSIDAVMIMSGETMATARLMVTEDMTDDAGAGMGEALHLYAVAGDTMSDTLELTIWDEAVPALPLVAQLLLALFLMAGGARLYRRRQG